MKFVEISMPEAKQILISSWLPVSTLSFSSHSCTLHWGFLSANLDNTLLQEKMERVKREKEEVVSAQVSAVNVWFSKLLTNFVDIAITEGKRRSTVDCLRRCWPRRLARVCVLCTEMFNRSIKTLSKYKWMILYCRKR